MEPLPSTKTPTHDSRNNHDEHNIETKPNSTTFEAVARKYGTNKVTSHRYQFMYEKYLGPLQGKPVKFLEVGLGCNMVTTPCHVNYNASSDIS